MPDMWNIVNAPRALQAKRPQGVRSAREARNVRGTPGVPGAQRALVADRARRVRGASDAMPARTVNLAQDAYELLASRKLDRESFSDVVRRLAGERSLFDLVGVLDEGQAKKLQERIEAGRERARRRRARQLR